ncbi:kinase-like protein [Gigaspora margarita]|uniref:Kinase-like protein n=1 Tax=Gigaspora margarita TaxID=4874 RepID=A0A8H4AL61_GIGMA|nr:kinase-like protein [Gigaspora margarita]
MTKIDKGGFGVILKQNRIIWFFNAQTVEIFGYWNVHFSKLDWSIKVRMAKEISNVSSGVPPFRDSKDLIEITLHVIKGNRETPTEGTPNDFKNLYCAARSVDPDSRPDVKEICNKLDHMQVAIETAIPFLKFIPIINGIINVTEEITLIHQSAEHNIHFSKSLFERIIAVEASHRLLKTYKDEHKEFCVTDENNNISETVNEINVVKRIQKLIENKFNKQLSCNNAVTSKYVADESDTNVKNDIRNQVVEA